VTRHHLAIGLAVVVAATAWGLSRFGVIELPDIETALEDLSDALGTWTYALVGGLAFLETGAFVGLVAPGETAIVLGGVVAAEGGVSLPVILLLAWVCAAGGDLVSFLLGRRLGRPFLVKNGPRFGVTAERLEMVDSFFLRHGGKAILIGRFIGIVRAVAPFSAGASGMKLRGFLPWSLSGTLVWASAFTVLGYVFSDSFATAAGTLTKAAFAGAALAGGFFIVRALLRRRRRRAEAATGPSPA